jgi:hypothetical protein
MIGAFMIELGGMKIHDRQPLDLGAGSGTGLAD